MKIELIKFGVPGKLSHNIYSFDQTKVSPEVPFKIIDIRGTSFNPDPFDLVECVIGKCQLMKDEEGVWIIGYDSSISITDELLSKSSNKYWSGGRGTQVNGGDGNNKVEDAEILFVYLSVEEDINMIIRDLKLTQIGI